MSKSYKNYLFLSLLLTGSLFASNNAEQFEIVSFDNLNRQTQKKVKNKIFLMLRNDQEMAATIETTAGGMRRYLSNLSDNKKCLISYLKGEPENVCGFMMCGLHDELSMYDESGKNYKSVGFISTIGVHENYRGKGIAQKLLNNFEDDCKRNQKQLMVLCVAVDNESAIKAYKKFGFSDQGLDTHDMSKMVKQLRD